LDFALILVIATAVSGLIWAFDAAVLKPRRSRSAGQGDPALEADHG